MKRLNYLRKLLSYLYIFTGFLCIIYYISYNIRITNKPEGWAIMLFNAVLCFIAYIAINHVFIRRIISNKFLIVIEALLFSAMLTLVISDVRYEAYLDQEYLRKTTPRLLPSHPVMSFEKQILLPENRPLNY
ncbi:hypothetical protein D7V95_14290 [bacterium J10(2018)]|nr:hypothetical protein D7V95_14290 [bacterium J10(2018)]